MEGTTVILCCTIFLSLFIILISRLDDVKRCRRHNQIVENYLQIIELHQLNKKERITCLNLYDFQKYNLREALKFQNFE